LERINLTISECPDSSILYVKRGQLKRSQGLWKESIADCQISLDIMESTEAYWELGWCQEHFGSLKEALNSYTKAALIDSNLDWPQKRIEVVERKISKRF
jgi:tetratricopeptide (TPR) repeat protein